MKLPRDFLSYNNFESAFNRVVRGANKDYKAFYTHLLLSYNLALRENLLDVIERRHCSDWTVCAAGWPDARFPSEWPIHALVRQPLADCVCCMSRIPVRVLCAGFALRCNQHGRLQP